MKKIYLLGGANTTFIGKFHPDFIWKGHSNFGQKENPTLEGHLREAVRQALAETGVEPKWIDRGYVGNFAGELFANQGHMGALIAGCDGLANKPFMRVEGACASGGLAMMCAIDAIQAGSDVVLVAGAEVQTTRNAKEGADYLARASHYATQRSLDPFTFPCLFARRAKAVLSECDLTEEDLGRVVVKAYSNGNKNPKAHMHTVKVTLEDAKTASDKNPCFLKNPDYHDYLKVKDCSQVSDGASALLLVSQEGLEKLGKSKDDCVEIVGWSYLAAPIQETPPLTCLDTTQKTADLAYKMAGQKPQDIQVAEVHDCFSITEILMYEALGFAPEKKGSHLIREGVTQLDGALPVNTGGGLIAFGHPVGATGIKQALEIYRQIKGKCGDYQMPSAPQIGLSANMGGDDRTSVVMIYREIGL